MVTVSKAGQPPVTAADGASAPVGATSASAEGPGVEGSDAGAPPTGPGSGTDAFGLDTADPYAPDTGFTVPGVAAADAGRLQQPGGPLDIAITIGGLVVAVLLAVGLAVFEAFLVPLRVSDLGLSDPGKSNLRLPVALILALVTNPLLVWFVITTTGRRLAALLPAGAWCVVWVLAAARTTEGDLLLTDSNWVGLATLLSGPIVFAVAIYRSVLRQRLAPPANSKATPLAPQSVDR